MSRVKGRIESTADRGVYPTKYAAKQIEQALANEQIGEANTIDRQIIQQAAAEYLFILQQREVGKAGGR